MRGLDVDAIHRESQRQGITSHDTRQSFKLANQNAGFYRPIKNKVTSVLAHARKEWCQSKTNEKRSFRGVSHIIEI